MKFKRFLESDMTMPNQGNAQPKVRYSAIVLDESSRERLIQELESFLEPLLAQGWVMRNSPPPGVPPEPLPHHMTICIGPLPDDMKSLIGTRQQLTAVSWGQSDLAAAVGVQTSIRSSNNVPHITMAVSPMGKPFHSNQIQEWVSLETRISLTGIIEEVS